MQQLLFALQYPGKNEHVLHGPDRLIVGTSLQSIEKTIISGAGTVTT